MEPLQNNITDDIAQSFKNIVGIDYFFADEESLQHYSHDETETLSFKPHVVLKPRTAAEGNWVSHQGGWRPLSSATKAPPMIATLWLSSADRDSTLNVPPTFPLSHLHTRVRSLPRLSSLDPRLWFTRAGCNRSNGLSAPSATPAARPDVRVC